ncbi:Hypothetical predicted protein, partial [Pelobates cultripes]
VSDESVKAFAEHCPSLQYVGFMGCSVTSEGVIHLTKLKHLSSLDLRHITKLDNETVMEVVRRCHSLTSLNLCLNRSINDRYQKFCTSHLGKIGTCPKEQYVLANEIYIPCLMLVGRYYYIIKYTDQPRCGELADFARGHGKQCCLIVDCYSRPRGDSIKVSQSPCLHQHYRK